METIVIEENGVAAAFELHAFGTAASGPRLFFTAGIHGNEVTGVYVARMLIDHLEAQPLLRGEVRVIPAVNAAAMRCMQRCNPFDGEDLNRIFPGDAAGSISHRLAAAVWERTASADALVDLHCCGQHGLPYILALHGESPAARELARRIPLPRCVQSYGSAGQLFVESARRRGQASCIIELPSGAGEGAVNLETAQMCFHALLDLLRSYGMLAGEVSGASPAFFGPLLDADCERAGFWRPRVRRGEAIAKGQLIGTLDGAPVAAPEAGAAMSVRPPSYLRANDLWAVVYVQPERENEIS